MRSNSPLTIVSIIAIGFFLASCGSSPETPLLTGVCLTTQPMIADVGGAKVGEVVKGSTVECIGFSPDSSTVKIRFGSEEGWVFRPMIAFNAQPAIALRYSALSQGGSSGGNAILENTILAVDSTVGDTAHVSFVREGVRYDGWVKTSDISTNPKDIAMMASGETAPETLTCTFRDVGLGDCWHVEFDCGDYGDADTSQLDPAGRALWESLSIEDANGDGVANPEYVGKKFIMRVGQTRGSACNEGQGGEGDVPLLLEFRLAGN